MNFLLEGPGGLTGIQQGGGFTTNLSATFKGAVDMSAATSVTLPATGSGATTITSASANALTVGPNGTTNPVFNVDDSTASAATGLNVKGAAAASGLALSVLSSGNNENLTLDAKGSGSIILGATSTGGVGIGAAGAKPFTIKANTGNDYLQLKDSSGTDKWHLTGATNILLVETGVATRVQFTVGGGVVLTTSAAGNALTVGTNGATNSAFNVDTSTASSATGFNLKSAAAGGGLAATTTSSGTDENLTIAAKGLGTITFNPAVTATAGGASNDGIKFGSIGVGLFTGTGAPGFSAMNGSIYVDSNATTTTTRIYVNKSGAGTAGTTWTNLTTAT